MCPREALFLPLTEYYEDPRDGLMRQSAISLLGQRGPTVQMFRSCNGPTRRLCLLPTGYYAGRCGSLVRQPAPHWMGQCGSIVQMSPTYMGPHDSLLKQLSMPLIGPCEPLVQTLRACNGPTRGLVPPQNIMLAHTMVPCGSSPCPWWANAGQWSKCYIHAMGPPEGCASR